MSHQNSAEPMTKDAWMVRLIKNEKGEWILDRRGHDNYLTNDYLNTSFWKKPELKLGKGSLQLTVIKPLSKTKNDHTQ